MRILAVAVVTMVLAAVSARAVVIERVLSPSGLEAWLVEDHVNPIISLDFAVRGGAALDPADKIGLASMVGGLLDEGAGDLDSAAFQSKLADLGILFGCSAAEDSFFGHLKTLTANRETAQELMRLALTRPRFDADAVERVRGQILSRLERELQDPDTIADREFARRMFPDHPYGRPVDGTPESIKAITAADLHGWVAHHLGRDQLFVAVVGDLTPVQLAPLLDRIFGALPPRAAPIEVAEAVPSADGRTEVLRRAIPQSVVQFGEQGLRRGDPDWYAAFVLNYVLGGGGLSSRLMDQLRAKNALAYGVYSELTPYDHAALIVGGVATRNARVADSLRLVRQEWRRMAEGGISADELASAKTYLNGSFPLEMDSTAAIASLLLTVQREGLGIDYFDRRPKLIDAVGLADIKRVAKRLLHADKLTAVVVGDPQGMQDP